ncbi:MAG TPA: DUF302 domain-containing protein [Gammaproteobacteria bacterium]|nr:DUF302 domain-containing protein [Gammaproteobacteria bacterium]
MSRFTTHSFRLVLLLLLVFSGNLHANGSSNSYEKKTDKSLRSTLEDIEFALTERNLRIVSRLHIGQGIRQRGYENFPEYEIILYCNLEFARKMLEIAPSLINACPGRITVRSDGELYIISAVLWPEDNRNPRVNKLMYDMNTLVREIVDHAVQEWQESYEN